MSKIKHGTEWFEGARYLVADIKEGMDVERRIGIMMARHGIISTDWSILPDMWNTRELGLCGVFQANILMTR